MGSAPRPAGARRLRLPIPQRDAAVWDGRQVASDLSSGAFAASGIEELDDGQSAP